MFPFVEHIFDKVISSLVFHHLNRIQKELALIEIYRILKPGGEVLIADWGKPSGLLMRACFIIIQLLDGFEATSDNVLGNLPIIIKQQGFRFVEEIGVFDTLFGTIRLIKAVK